jgi:hypothetical protein
MLHPKLIQNNEETVDAVSRSVVPPSSLPGFYKIDAKIEGLPTWVQYFDGRIWHGATPPAGSNIEEVNPKHDGDKLEDRPADGMKEAEAAGPTTAEKGGRLPEQDVFSVPNIEVQEFQCRTCGGTELVQRPIKERGVKGFEILCLSCERAATFLPWLLKLPLSAKDNLILDPDGKTVASCAWSSEDAHANAIIANNIVAALNAWDDLTQLVSSTEPGKACYFYGRLLNRVRSYSGGKEPGGDLGSAKS